jgi:zinc/manganese transport system substrate-binding protein
VVPSARGARRGLRHVLLAGCALIAGTALLAGCDATPNGSPIAGQAIHVVAAENFWGSLVSQLGGARVSVTSIVTNPSTDPHSYEPTTQDAVRLAGAQLVIENGIGYDPWVAKLLSADEGHPRVLNVGDLLGVAVGGNPHRWYDPSDVQRVIATIVADLQATDPKGRAYFAARARRFTTIGLRPYRQAIAAIRLRYAGTKVGASESIFAMLAPALGLRLITPPTFLRAISEGTDVSAADKETIDRQIANHLIRIYVYNSQNVTPDVQAQLSEAKAEHIPVVTITETLAPASATFEAWQTSQLRRIASALAEADGRSPR